MKGKKGERKKPVKTNRVILRQEVRISKKKTESKKEKMEQV